MYLKKNKKRHLDKYLLCILLISFVIPVMYAFHFQIQPVVDAKAYDFIAVNIVQGFGFVEHNDAEMLYDTSIVRAGPGYEYFLAILYYFFGHHYFIVWIAQALLHTVSAWIIFLITIKLFKDNGDGNKIGLIATGLFAFSPDLIEISAMLMTETVYLFFIILIVYIFVLLFEKRYICGLSTLFGAITGLGILMRPPIILFVPAFLFFLFFRKKNYRATFLFCISLFAVLLPWVVRNYFIYNQLILTTLIAQYNLWVGNTLISNGGQIAGGYNALTEYVSKYGYLGLKTKANTEFLSFLIYHPFVFVKLTFLRFVKFFSLTRPMGFWFYQNGIGQIVFVISSLFWITTIFVMGFSGMVFSLIKGKKIFYYLSYLVLSSIIVLLPTVVESRYRFSIYPFLCIFAAYMIILLLKNRNINKIFLYITIIFFVLITSLDLLFSFQVVFDRIILLF